MPITAANKVLNRIGDSTHLLLEAPFDVESHRALTVAQPNTSPHAVITALDGRGPHGRHTTPGTYFPVGYGLWTHKPSGDR